MYKQSSYFSTEWYVTVNSNGEELTNATSSTCLATLRNREELSPKVYFFFSFFTVGLNEVGTYLADRRS